MKLAHPNSNQTIEPAEGDVELYRSQGWVPAAQKRPAKKRAASTGAATTTDPAA